MIFFLHSLYQSAFFAADKNWLKFIDLQYAPHTTFPAAAVLYFFLPFISSINFVFLICLQRIREPRKVCQLQCSPQVGCPMNECNAPPLANVF